MNKSQLISAVADKAGLKKEDAKVALEAVLDSITDALKENEKISLVGFGTFAVSERAARTGINPATKEKIQIPAKKVVKFKPGSELQDI